MVTAQVEGASIIDISTPMAHEKSGLRRDLRARRGRLCPAVRRRGALAAARRGLRLLRPAARVGAYLPHGTELDPRPLMYALLHSKRAVYLPVVSRTSHCPLSFRLWRPPFGRNHYGIMEPRWGRRLKGRQLDAVLVPLIGFDARGQRLGQGGGHYDRTFGFLARKRRARPRLIGLAFECQQLPYLPTETHDVRLHAVLTEKKVHRMRGVL